MCGFISFMCWTQNCIRKCHDPIAIPLKGLGLKFHRELRGLRVSSLSLGISAAPRNQLRPLVPVLLTMGTCASKIGLCYFLV